jgi:hypothetical protein
LGETIKDTSELIILFGEDDSVKSTEFFAMFYNFAREFSNAYKNILLGEKVKQEQEEKKRLALLNDKKDSTTNKSNL